MTVVLIIIGYLVITLISNALTNLVIFNDEFELDTDATAVLLAYRIHRIQMKNYKAVVEEDKTEEDKTSETKEA